MCTVIGIAVDHETIRCIAGCNETTTTGITSKFPYVSSEICVPELGLFHRRTDAVGKHISTNYNIQAYIHTRDTKICAYTLNDNPVPELHKNV